MKIHELFCQPQTLLLDGGFGTMLQAAGLRPGARPEELNLTEPDLVRSTMRLMRLRAARVLNTNTFGASAPKLAGSGYTVEQVVQAAVALCRPGSRAVWGTDGTGYRPFGGDAGAGRPAEL